MRMRDEDGHQALLEAGRAWKRVKSATRRLWHDWTMVIGPGLVKAKAEATSIANAPSGRGYNTAMSALLQTYGLDDMEGATRKHMLDIMDHLAMVEAWHRAQPNRERLNHPTTVWRQFERSAEYQTLLAERGLAKIRKDHASSPAKPSLLEENKAMGEEIDALKERIKELEEERDIAKEARAQLEREVSAEFHEQAEPLEAEPSQARDVSPLDLRRPDTKRRIKHAVTFCGSTIWPKDSLAHVTYDDMNAGWHLAHYWTMHLERATPQKPKEVAVQVRHLIWDIHKASSIEGLVNVMLACISAYSKANDGKDAADFGNSHPPGLAR